MSKTSPTKTDHKGEEDYKKKVVKKKGVGYGGNTSQKWNVSDYMESKKSVNEQLMGMIEIICNFIQVKNWNPPKQIVHEICCSALLPLLEASFRSASLLDMTKELSLN